MRREFQRNCGNVKGLVGIGSVCEKVDVTASKEESLQFLLKTLGVGTSSFIAGIP